MVPAIASAEAPNGSLSVAYRQSEDGKLGESVFQVTLSCWDGTCSLTSLSLNQCGFGAFYPKVERWSTDERGFSVAEIAPGRILVEQQGEAQMTYEFRYTTRDNPSLAQRLQLKRSRFFENLTGFSGAAVKYSPVQQKVISWNFVPLRGRNPRVRANCEILLDGVPE
jgi:hypothetical protein